MVVLSDVRVKKRDWYGVIDVEDLGSLEEDGRLYRDFVI